MLCAWVVLASLPGAEAQGHRSSHSSSKARRPDRAGVPGLRVLQTERMCTDNADSADDVVCHGGMALVTGAAGIAGASERICCACPAGTISHYTGESLAFQFRSDGIATASDGSLVWNAATPVGMAFVPTRTPEPAGIEERVAQHILNTVPPRTDVPAGVPAGLRFEEGDDGDDIAMMMFANRKIIVGGAHTFFAVATPEVNPVAGTFLAFRIGVVCCQPQASQGVFTWGLGTLGHDAARDDGDGSLRMDNWGLAGYRGPSYQRSVTQLFVYRSSLKAVEGVCSTDELEQVWEMAVVSSSSGDIDWVSTILGDGIFGNAPNDHEEFDYDWRDPANGNYVGAGYMIMGHATQMYQGLRQFEGVIHHLELHSVSLDDDAVRDVASGLLFMLDPAAEATPACTECTAGTYDHDADPSTRCIPCEHGTFAASTGSSMACSGLCPLGLTLLGTGSVSVDECSLCSAGKYGVITDGASHCAKCPPGRVSTVHGATSDAVCMPCDEGTFNKFGSTSCESSGCLDDWASNFRAGAIVDEGLCAYDCPRLREMAGAAGKQGGCVIHNSDNNKWQSFDANGELIVGGDVVTDIPENEHWIIQGRPLAGATLLRPLYAEYGRRIVSFHAELTMRFTSLTRWKDLGVGEVEYDISAAIEFCPVSPAVLDPLRVPEHQAAIGSSRGGRMFASYSNVTTTHTFFGNSCWEMMWVGLVYVDVGSWRASDTVMARSSVAGADQVQFWAVENHVTHSRIEGNYATSHGTYEIYESMWSSSVTFEYTHFMDNVVEAGRGGSIFLGTGCLLRVKHSSFTRGIASDGGGAIDVALDAYVILEHVQFKDNAAGIGTSAALHFDRPGSVKILKSTFDPFEDGSNTVFMSGRLGGCLEHPCALGQSCAYANFSLSCSKCEGATVGLDGIACVPCPVGFGPNEEKTACEPCAANEFGIGICQHCAPPNVVSADKISCGLCRPGYGPNGDSTTCEACVGTQYSVFGVCQDCLPPSVMNDDRTSCGPSACIPGTTCPEGTTCSGPDDCVQCPAGAVSLGGACTECTGNGKVAGPDQVSCVSCAPGQEPNAERTACANCIGTTYSQIGVECVQCDNVVNSDRTSCSICAAGTGPNAERTACLPCIGNSVATFGVCQRCTGGTVANEVKTQCDDVSQTADILTDIAVVADVLGGNSSNLLPQISLRLMSIEPAALIEGSPAHSVFTTNFVVELAASLGIHESDIYVTKIATVESDGRRRMQTDGQEATVAFVIASTNVVAVLRTLQNQLDDPNSPLLSSPTTGAIDPNMAPTFSFVCPLGTMRTVGATQCTSCPGNEVPNDEQSACKACGVGTTPAPDGVACICNSGFYQYLETEDDSFQQPVVCHEAGFERSPRQAQPGCNKCDQCVRCNHLNVTVAPGYIRVFGPPVTTTQRGLPLGDAQPPPISVFKCIYEHGCHGVIGVHSNQTECKTCEEKTLPMATGCQYPFTGHFCATCIDGYEMETADGEQQQCVPCDDALKSSWWVPCTILGLAALLFAFKTKLLKLLAPQPEKMDVMRAIVRSGWQPVRIVITYAQITGELGRVLEFTPPEMFKALVDTLAATFRISALDVFSSAKCLGVDTFHHKWTVQVVIVPLVVTVVPIVVFLIKRQKDHAIAVDAIRGQLFFVVFLVYPSVCSYCFACFVTLRVAPDVAVLVSDDRLLYGDDEHMPYRYASMALIASFAFGVPVGAAGLLFKAQQQLTPVDTTLKAHVSEAFHISMGDAEAAVNDIVMGSAYGFLTDAFKPKFFMTESLDMLRKLALVGGLVFVQRGSVTQTMIGLGLALGFLCRHMKSWPYKFDADNNLRAATEVHTCLTIAVALVFRTDMDSTKGSYFGTEGEDAFRVYTEDIADRRRPYDWVLMSTFIVCVPGMFILTIARKVRGVKQTLRPAAQTAEAQSDKQARMCFTFERFRLGLTTGSETKDLADYITIELALQNEHQRAGMRLWNDMEVASHLSKEQMSSLLTQMESELPKSHSLGYHFTDLDSCRLILGSLGIRASTVGQLGGGVSITLASPVDLGWDKLGPAAFHQGCGEALWGKSPVVFDFLARHSARNVPLHLGRSKLFCKYTIDELSNATFCVHVTAGSKWYEVMPGDPPLDLEKKIESKEWAGTLPAARDEWGSWSKKLEVCLVLRIPSKEDRDPRRIVPGRDDVFIVPQAECILNEADGARYLSNKTIEKVLLLKPPDPDYVPVLDSIANENINARVQCSSDRDEHGAMTQVQLASIAVDSRDEARPNEKTPWCDSIVKFTACIPARPDDPSQVYLQRHRMFQDANPSTKHWPENIARFTKNEMKAALIAIDQAEMRSYTIVYHYCSEAAARRMCESGCGLDAGLTITTLSPIDLNWEKYAGGKFKDTASEALWGVSWRDTHNVGELQAVLIMGVPSSVVADGMATSISKQMTIPESLLMPDDSSTGTLLVYSNAFVRKSYVLESVPSSSVKPAGEPAPADADADAVDEMATGDDSVANWPRSVIESSSLTVATAARSATPPKRPLTADRSATPPKRSSTPPPRVRSDKDQKQLRVSEEMRLTAEKIEMKAGHPSSQP